MSIILVKASWRGQFCSEALSWPLQTSAGKSEHRLDAKSWMDESCCFTWEDRSVLENERSSISLWNNRLKKFSQLWHCYRFLVYSNTYGHCQSILNLKVFYTVSDTSYWWSWQNWSPEKFDNVPKVTKITQQNSRISDKAALVIFTWLCSRCYANSTVCSFPFWFQQSYEVCIIITIAWCSYYHFTDVETKAEVDKHLALYQAAKTWQGCSWTLIWLSKGLSHGPSHHAIILPLSSISIRTLQGLTERLMSCTAWNYLIIEFKRQVGLE